MKIRFNGAFEGKILSQQLKGQPRKRITRCLNICIYIYISLCVCVYIYTYICIHMYTMYHCIIIDFKSPLISLNIYRYSEIKGAISPWSDCSLLPAANTLPCLTAGEPATNEHCSHKHGVKTLTVPCPRC